MIFKSMKKLLFLMLVSAFSLLLQAANYKVNVETELNVRASASADAPLIGKLSGGMLLNDVTIYDNGWALITFNGKEGYVKADYLTKVDGRNVVQSDGGQVWYALLNWSGTGHKSLVYWIGACLLIMWVVCKFVRLLETDFYPRRQSSDGLIAFNVLLLCVCAGLIFYYVAKMGSNALWFLLPSEVGSWWYAIMNGIFFIYALINLLAHVGATLNEIGRRYECNINLRFGIVTWGIAIIGYIVCFWWFKEYLNYLFIGLCICQVIQVIVLGCNVWPKGGMLGALFISLVYIVGTTSVVVLVVPLVVIAIILVIAVIALYVVASMPVGSGSNSYSGSSSFGSTASEEPEESRLSWDNEWIEKKDKPHARVVDVDANGIIRDSDGERWRDDGFGRYKKV